MSATWKPLPIKDYNHYSISWDGQVYNTKYDRYLKAYKNGPSDLLYIRLSNKGKEQLFGIHKLVALAFGKITENTQTAIHLDYIQDNNIVPNLEGSTRGDAAARTKRYNNEQKAKLRGIHKWNMEYRQ